MASTRKNGQYFFGLKAHIGTDINTNVIHTVTITAANESDVGQMSARDKEKVFMVNDKRKPKHTKNKKKNLSSTQKKRNRKISQLRAKVEHCF